MNTHATLRREVGLGGAVVLGLGSMLGTGVFVGLGIAAGYTGGGVLLAVILSALLALCNALSSAQLAASHAVAGGTYAYGYRYLTPALGFTAGWVFICAKCASAATAALACAAYGLAMADAMTPMREMILAMVLLTLLTILVLSGLRRSNALNAVLVMLVVLVLMTFVVTCSLNAAADTAATAAHWSMGPFEGVARSAGSPIVNLLTATALTFVAYTGYGRVATLGEEVHDPRRTIPRAIMLVMACTAMIYIAVAGAALLAVGAEAFATIGSTSDQPLRAIAEALDQTLIAQIISIGALLAMLGVALNLLLGVSRVVLAMGRQGDLPRMFANLDRSQRTPVAAVLFTAIVMAALILIGDLRLTWSFSAFTVLIYYAITNLAALRLPRDDCLYPRWISICGLVGCLSLAWFVEARVWMIGILIILAGLSWRLAATRLTGRSA